MITIVRFSTEGNKQVEANLQWLYAELENMYFHPEASRKFAVSSTTCPGKKSLSEINNVFAFLY